MSENPRQFEVADPFGRLWQAELRWQQNAISIRHADAVDCKYYLSCADERREVVIALAHPDLVTVSQARNRDISDAWCLRLAAAHLRRSISTWQDMEQSIISPTCSDLDRLSLEIEQRLLAQREKAALAR